MIAPSKSDGIIGCMICQREKDASAIDLIAATIIPEAARAAGLVDDPLREARSGGRRKMYLLMISAALSGPDLVQEVRAAACRDHPARAHAPRAGIRA